MNPHVRVSLQDYQYYTLPVHRPSKKKAKQITSQKEELVQPLTEDQVRVLTCHFDLMEQACLSGQVCNCYVDSY